MGEAAENKILLLLKQTRREEESEANKLLQILRNRPKTAEPQQAETRPAAFVAEVKEGQAIPRATEIFSLPGLSALHLFSFLREESFNRLPASFESEQDGWLRYFFAMEPFVATEVAGLPNLPIHADLSSYRSQFTVLLRKLLFKWRLKHDVFLEDLDFQELDEMLIRLLERLKILVAQGRLQQVSTLDSSKKTIAFLSVLKPDSFAATSNFLQKKTGSLFAHLAFMVTLMAQEVVINRPGQLRAAIAVGETLHRLREKLFIMIHRMALRSHLGDNGWEENSRTSSIMTALFNQIEMLFTLNSTETKGGEDGLL